MIQDNKKKSMDPSPYSPAYEDLYDFTDYVTKSKTK